MIEIICFYRLVVLLSIMVYKISLYINSAAKLIIISEILKIFLNQ